MARNKKQPDLHWYKDAIIYELHIKAFCDSNGDGIGDFRGLISKLDYLHELGVTAIWLLPFYPSPLKDDGYDIADYYSVNPSYGTMEDFREFLDQAHARGLRVITELVINHTSDQHPWFQRAREAPADSPERNFYVWSNDPHKYPDVRIIFQDFETSNWTWDPVADQYYWHRFFHHQPDLNYDSPLVQEEIFRLLDYWCKMGVDGFRLDAVPYLFEREGTNGENLPETHAFLKKIRAHMDRYYPGTLMLAEANMWPEDSASYFGNGDECHMNYHFPVMPRIFMSLQMEDRHPLTDIFDQTPQIPENCQWAIFLRNHDELTLEMVTDEERDYMYKVYVKDPKARINLGIRHRLAPLMDNNRKKIELLNYLLFSLPGTPVLYYGDEIGMGDNFYLGDRDGVRTPMQWSAESNAGFSDANPQQLYLPLILDPQYHYGIVNVELQSHNTSSLLWWTRKLIMLRKKHKAFGHGNMQFLEAENPKILAFTRTFRDETILVVVNLSRFIQPVKLDLDHYAGSTPVEIMSNNAFPPVEKDRPYFFTLSAHDCQWYILQTALAANAGPLPVSELGAWEEIVNRESLEHLETHVLRNYLPKTRWFGGKARRIENIRITDHIPFELKNSQVFILLIEVRYQSGLPETYQLSIAWADHKAAGQLRSNFPAALISDIKIAGRNVVLYDAIFSEEFQLALFESMAFGSRLALERGELQCSGSNILKNYLQEHKNIRPRVLSAEQSNTSIVYDNAFFLKIYRKVDNAMNPDPELTYFLTEKARFPYVPAFLGSVEWKNRTSAAGGTMVLGMLQEMVESSGDAWTYILDRLNSFNEKILSEPQPLNNERSRLNITNPPSVEEIDAQTRELLEGIVAEQIRLLGVRTGQMHLALASDHHTPEFKPEPFSLHYQRSLFSSFQSLVRVAFQSLAANMDKLPGQTQAEAKEVLEMKNDILAELKKIYRKKLDVVKTRVHGDYHLGQVLCKGMDFVILDFEGEPARTYSERRLKRSPLKDVAGMIRSLHYAAYGSLLLDDHISEEDRARLFPYADTWFNYMAGFYMHAYLETVKETLFIPADPADLEVLMRTFLLEKAIYELNYELNNRPAWVLIPLRGIKAIMEGARQAEKR